MTTNIDYLIPLLRLKVGDLNPASYRYVDSWLVTSLVASVKTYWNTKYVITDLGDITRSTTYSNFTTDEAAGVIEARDEYPIVLLAAIIILQGSLQASSWNLASWKDAEISFTNLEGGKIQNANLSRLFDELYSFVKPPSKKLAWTLSGPLVGYHNNRSENKHNP